MRIVGKIKRQGLSSMYFDPCLSDLRLPAASRAATAAPPLTGTVLQPCARMADLRVLTGGHNHTSAFRTSQISTRALKYPNFL